MTKAEIKEQEKQQRAAKESSLHPTMLAMSRAKERRAQKSEMTKEKKQETASSLITLMLETVEEDNTSNSLRKPALKKIFELEHVTKELRRIPIQEAFIENGGCDALANWLYPLPDGTFPNVKVVSEILSVIETMSIEVNSLE